MQAMIRIEMGHDPFFTQSKRDVVRALHKLAVDIEYGDRLDIGTEIPLYDSEKKPIGSLTVEAVA